VIQFHYTAWPDFGVPSSPGAFLDFLWAVRASGALDTAVHGPPVIHCSAGIGRSGTFCLVDACLVLVRVKLSFIHLTHNSCILIKVVPDFGSGSGKSEIRPFFGNPPKSGSSQISSRICRIWQIPVKLQYVRLITGQTNAVDPSRRVFAILIFVTWMIKIQNPLLFHKFRLKLANSDITKEALNCTASL